MLKIALPVEKKTILQLMLTHPTRFLLIIEKILFFGHKSMTQCYEESTAQPIPMLLRKRTLRILKESKNKI